MAARGLAKRMRANNGCGLTVRRKRGSKLPNPRGCRAREGEQSERGRIEASRARLQKLNVASPVSRRNRLRVTALDTAVDHFIPPSGSGASLARSHIKLIREGAAGCRLQSSGIARVVYDRGNFHRVPRQVYSAGISHAGRQGSRHGAGNSVTLSIS